MTIDDLEKLEDERCRAMAAGDLALLGTLFSDDLRWVHASGGVDTKATMIGQFSRGEMAVHSLERSDVDLRVFGYTGVASGTVAMDATVGLVRREVRSRYQAVWSSHDGTPRLVSWLSARAG